MLSNENRDYSLTVNNAFNGLLNSEGNTEREVNFFKFLETIGDCNMRSIYAP